MGILLALLLGASSPCADGQCPLPTSQVVCANGECGDSKCDAGCNNCKCSAKCCGKKVVSSAKSVTKSVRSRCRIFRRRR